MNDTQIKDVVNKEVGCLMLFVMAAVSLIVFGAIKMLHRLIQLENRVEMIDGKKWNDAGKEDEK